MVGSLGPAVRGAERGRQHRLTILHSGGLLAGALIAGLALAIAGGGARALDGRDFLRALEFAALAVALIQLGGGRLPQSRWQVPEHWRRHFDIDVLAIAYGLLLGVGVLTAVVVGAFWVFFAASLLLSPGIVILGWIAYAVGRVGGFAVMARTEHLERIFLKPPQQRFLILATALLGAAAVIR